MVFSDAKYPFKRRLYHKLKMRKKPGPKTGSGRASSPRLNDEQATAAAVIDMIFRQTAFDMLGFDSPLTEVVFRAIDGDPKEFQERAESALKTRDSTFFTVVADLLKRRRDIEQGYRNPGLIGGIRLVYSRLFLRKGKTPTWGETLDFCNRCKWWPKDCGYSDARLREETQKAGIKFARAQMGPKSKNK